MIHLLLENPLLLLFVVAAIGYPLGRLKLWGSSLGIAGVLFAGLAVGALHPDLKLPEVVYLLGLAIFVYTVGLSSGPGFFASFRRKGIRDNSLVVAVLVGAAALTFLAARLLSLKPALAAGMFAGSLTNTPALAGELDFLKRWAAGGTPGPILADPVVGYSIAYPMGVLGMILAIAVLQRLWKVNYAEEAQQSRELREAKGHLVSRTVRVTDPAHSGRAIGELFRKHQWEVVFGRIDHEGHEQVVTADTVIDLDDRLSIVGRTEDVEAVIQHLGEHAREAIDLDRREVDFRRIFVSNPRVAGRRIRDLDLIRKFGAIVTRVKRGDQEFLPHPDTVLDLGDRVRVLTTPRRLTAVRQFFGDSFRALSEIDVLTFSLGVALGLLVGLVPIPLPGGVVLTLGFAGGPLVVALVLGALSRTGPMVWTLPYNANLTLRQVGLILFLAGVGTRAGYSFVTTFTQGGGVAIFVAGALLTFLVALSVLVVGRWLRIPMSVLIGLLAGLQTQPAVLGFALEQTGDEGPNIGYTTAYPIATVTKIVLAQVLLSLLLRS